MFLLTSSNLVQYKVYSSAKLMAVKHNGFGKNGSGIVWEFNENTGLCHLGS